MNIFDFFKRKKNSAKDDNLLNLDKRSNSKEFNEDLAEVKATAESISKFLMKYYDDFPDPQSDPAGFSIDMKFKEIYLDEQIFLLKGIILKNANAKRALKLLGSRYFWTLKNAYVDSAIKCLVRYTDIEKQANTSSSFEILGGLYLLKNDETKALNYFRKSPRMDIPFVIRTYGGLIQYSDQQRNGNVGLRFKDFESGRYSLNDLIL